MCCFSPYGGLTAGVHSEEARDRAFLKRSFLISQMFGDAETEKAIAP